MRGEYAKSAERRQQIVDAAVEVFSSVGYRKGSLRDVANKVGLSQAGVLDHFPSKEHLLEAVPSWRDGETARLMGTRARRASTSCAAWSGRPQNERDHAGTR